MARGGAKNFKKSAGSLAAGNSPTNAVTTTDISVTVRVYDHAGLGSPPPKHLGVQSGVGISSHQIRRCSFPAAPFPILATPSPAGPTTPRKANQPRSWIARRARASDI